MSSTITRLSRHLSRGELQKAQMLVANCSVIDSGNATVGADNVKLLGMILHISKAKKVVATATLFGGKKKVKKEVSYFRMVFCR